MMKRFAITLLFSVCSLVSSAQSPNKTAEPLRGITVEREVQAALIGDRVHLGVVVELSAADSGDRFASGVKISVRDADTGRKIYKKRFPKTTLYLLPDESLQVRKNEAFILLVLYKANDEWRLVLREQGIT